MKDTSDIMKEQVEDVRFLISASEAYPALERAFLDAQSQITAGFRIFDLSTKLRSDEARKIGDDWFDLVVYTLERGVSITFILSDFDPVLANELHATSWKSRRAFMAVREVAQGKYNLKVINAAHPARVGLLPRMMLWPRLYARLKKLTNDLNNSDRVERDHMFRLMPGIHRSVTQEGNGLLKAKRWPVPRLIPVTHHQKIATFDDDLLYIGGLDLDERRYDDKGHHRRRDETWHDIQMMCRGPVVKKAQTHLDEFLDVIANHRTPSSGLSPIVRTLSAQRSFQQPFLSPKQVCHSIADRHMEALQDARKLIYLETQFFRDRKLAKALAKQAREKPDLSMILVLPAAPEDVAFNNAHSADARFGEYLQARCVKIITDAFKDRILICSPVRPEKLHSDRRDTLNGSPIIYVHAKVSIFDDDLAMVSSANLNGRSMYWDTEAGVVLDDTDTVGHLRHRCFDHWLGQDADTEHHDLAKAVPRWTTTVQHNAQCDPDERQGFLVPYQPGPARKRGLFLPGISDAMV